MKSNKLKDLRILDELKLDQCYERKFILVFWWMVECEYNPKPLVSQVRILGHVYSNYTGSLVCYNKYVV